MFVLEYINSCCFSHEDPEIYGKYETLNAALVDVKKLEDLTVKQMKDQNLWLTNIRVLDLDNYPDEVYFSEVEKYLGEYGEDEPTNWIVRATDD